ncbi:hypothetical protein, partial [Chitinimonas sp.]|uniref:hypothetical protein n=1 Tax=Chitinimonas sp. TaxID=1934313 RepID=UPI002F9517D8
RASQPLRRLQTIARLAEAGIPVGVLAAPMIPALNDHELEKILGEARRAGASMAGYVLLRLPLELAQLFEDWLAAHYPLKHEHVMSVLRQTRGGRDYDATFGQRMRGVGPFAELLNKRYHLAVQRLGLNARWEGLDHSLFRPPSSNGQLDLFAN